MEEREMTDLPNRKNQDDMEALFIRCRPLMRYIIAPILPNPQDREDCLSEAAVRIWENIEKFDPERGSFNTWLTAVTRNCALNFKRNTAAYGNTGEITSDISSSEPGPEEQVIRRERQAELCLALQKLSLQDKTLFYRKYYYRQSTAQIAAEMSMTERAVEGKLYRIRQKLRAMLGGE